MRIGRDGWRGLLVCAVIAGGPDWEVAAQPCSLVPEDVVVFVGGTNLLRLQQAGYWETMATSKFAAAQPRFRDLTWEADTAWRQGTVLERWREDGHGDLDALGNLSEQIATLEATVVVVQFGQLEALSGVVELERWTRTFEQLLQQMETRVRLVILVTPPAFEKAANPLVPDLSSHNADLAQYVAAIKRLARPSTRRYIDLFSHLPAGLTKNGMHVTPEAQPLVAKEMMRQLGWEVSPAEAIAQLRPAVMEKHRLWYDYWRPANWKLLFGDDARRQFTRGGENYVSFQKERERLLPLVGAAERRIWKIAEGKPDPGWERPAPEVLHGAPEADIPAELAAFTTLEGLQVNLFASEREGLTSPLAIRWDPSGRMYVTVTTTYPHVFPGDLPNDKILVLEDLDHDGQADRSTVFAEGLNIPTGLEWGDGGLYVGQNTELLFLADTNQDGRADQREVVLSGFGNGDSHQTINSFVWSPGGELFFGHGDGCESRVETPWGASELFNAGFYRLRPRRLQLIPFLEGHMGPGNPWGTAFDRWGQAFNVDGAGGVNWLTPGLVSTTHRRRLGRIGEPGGYCGIAYLDGRHLPASLKGDFVVGDFKANRVKRFSLQPQGAGFQLEWKEAILQSKHRNFRPVDVKVGPDGALYIVDWYNPITCHQDDAYRDPTRDKRHGRIWRVASTRPEVQPPALAEALLPEVVAALGAAEQWTRYQAKRELTRRPPETAAAALAKWVESLDPKQTEYEYLLYQALGAYATIEVVTPKLLQRLLQAEDPRARAYATRLVGRWYDRLEDPGVLLNARVADTHPQVRMEAVVACAAIPVARSVEIAARVLEQPLDVWTEYALRQTIRRLESWWLPALQRGELSFARPDQLAFVLNESDGEGVLESLKGLVNAGSLKGESLHSALDAILALGSPTDIHAFGLDPQRFTRDETYDAGAHAEVLQRVIAVAELREVRPEKDLTLVLKRLLLRDHAEVQRSALQLVGTWQVQDFGPHVLGVLEDDSLSLPVRAAALMAIAELAPPEAESLLQKFSAPTVPRVLRTAAIEGLAKTNLPAAASRAVELFAERKSHDPFPVATLNAFLGRQRGADALATACREKPLSASQAKELLRATYAAGVSHSQLVDALHGQLGGSLEPPAYTESYVQGLVSAASQRGNSVRGGKIFQRMACAACHKIAGAGGNIGPDLTALGTTLSPRRIVEELLWPNRQVKEGYTVVSVVTQDGKIYQGYEVVTREGSPTNGLVLRDLVTRERITLAEDEIEEKRVRGSSMPSGMTSLLTEPELLDLICYLKELGKLK